MSRQAATDLDTETAEHLSELADGINALEDFADGQLGGDGGDAEESLDGDDADDRASGQEAGGEADGEREAEGETRTAATRAEPVDDDADEAIITREDGARWNVKAGRWQKDGGFVEGEPPAGFKGTASAKDGAAGAGAAATAGATKDSAAGAAAEQTWEPFAVKVDRAQVPIEEAVISRSNGHTFIAVPDAKFNDFQRRIVRGYAAERAWRGIQEREQQLEREREIERNRPKIRTDSEVEADLMLDVLKPHLGDILDEQQLENLQLKVAIAQRDEKAKLATYETESRTKASEAETTQRAQDEGIATTIVELVEDPKYAAQFAHLTDDDLRGLIRQLQPVRNALYYRDGDGWVRNTQYMFDRLTELAAARKLGAAASTTTTGARGMTGTTATPSKDGTTAATGTATTRAERLNRAGETAARPTTTSVKAGRTATATRPSAQRSTTGTTRQPDKKDTRTPAMKAEDRVRTSTRQFMSSDGLDFDLDEDDGDD